MFCEGGDRSYRCLDVEFISVCLPLSSCQRSSFLLSSSVSELVFKTPVDFTEPSTSSLSARKSPMIPCQSESVCVWIGRGWRPVLGRSLQSRRLCCTEINAEFTLLAARFLWARERAGSSHCACPIQHPLTPPTPPT